MADDCEYIICTACGCTFEWAHVLTDESPDTCVECVVPTIHQKLADARRAGYEAAREQSMAIVARKSNLWDGSDPGGCEREVLLDACRAIANMVPDGETT